MTSALSTKNGRGSNRETADLSHYAALCLNISTRGSTERSQLLCVGSGPIIAPNLLEEKIPVAMLVRSSSRIRAQTHDLPVARGIVDGPVRHSAAVWISRTGKVSPEGLHQVGELVVLRPPHRSLARVQVAEDVLDLVGVESPGSDRMVAISW